MQLFKFIKSFTSVVGWYKQHVPRVSTSTYYNNIFKIVVYLPPSILIKLDDNDVMQAKLLNYIICAELCYQSFYTKQSSAFCFLFIDLSMMHFTYITALYRALASAYRMNYEIISCIK